LESKRLRKRNSSSNAAPSSPPSDSVARGSQVAVHKSPFPEDELLDFLGNLVVDLARNHPGVTSTDVMAWLGGLAAGSPKIEKLEERHLWERTAALAEDCLEKFPGSAPAKQFLEQFREKFGYEFGL
jgi:hypothetical protein